jgi:hypothetical protein
VTTLALIAAGAGSAGGVAAVVVRKFQRKSTATEVARKDAAETAPKQQKESR